MIQRESGTLTDQMESKMKNVLILAVLSVVGVAHADTYVNGYYRSNGTYVQPHYRTDSNSTINDNYTTRPNVNPYNGNVGTRQPEYSSSYGSSKARCTGFYCSKDDE